MIKKLFILIIMATGMVSCASEAQSNDKQDVAAAVEKLREALVSGDKAELEAIACDELTYGHSSGNIQNKAEFVQALVDGSSDFVSIDLTDQSIAVVGSTATVRHHLHAATNDKGKEPGTVDLHILTVWVKQDGSWKMLARQAVKSK